MSKRPRKMVERTPAVVEKFLTALRSGLSITTAAEDAGIKSRNTVYRWRADDKEFAAAMDDAVEAGTDSLEDEARRRGVDGVKKMVLHNGKPVLVPESGEYDQDGKPIGKLVPLYEHRYSDTMLAMQLNGRRPEKYRHRSEVVGAGGKPLIPENTLNDLELARRMAFILSRPASAAPVEPALPGEQAPAAAPPDSDKPTLQ